MGDQLAEVFADSGSESDFSGFDSDEGDGELDENNNNANEYIPGADGDRDGPVPSGYHHPWLQNFFRPGFIGPKHIPEDPTENDIMKLFLNDNFYDLAIQETNRYAENYVTNATLKENSRAHKWTPVTRDEMQAFIALLLLTGISKRSSYNLYWSSDPLIDMKGFRDIMTRDRFLSILQFFHLVNNEDALPREHANYDKGFKIRPLVNLLVPLWQHYYGPDKEVSVDESMIPFKGRTSLMQYMPAKPTKWGLKAWGLADAASGYMYNWQLYLGKDGGRPDNIPLGTYVVRTLAEPLLNKGHVIYMDNYFSSPGLFKELADNQTGACGTLRANRIGVPETIKRAKPKAGEPPVTDRDGHILYISWYDKKVVNLITTVHSAQTYQKEVRSKRHEDNIRLVDKPCAIQAYSQHMGGIDRADKAMTFYMVLHKCCKWWKKVFFYLLEVCFCNALVIWRGTYEKRTNAELFRLKIVHGMLRGYNRERSRSGGRPPAERPERLIGGEHYLGLNPHFLPNGQRSKPDCCVCSNRSKKRHQTIYICKRCDRAMCPYPCFERWHTLLNYKVDCTPALHNWLINREMCFEQWKG